MVVFGLVSSLFDAVTFAFLLLVAGATAQIFQTGWFVESLITELAIVLVVRTRKAFWRSRPGALLSWLTLAVALFAVAIPYLNRPRAIMTAILSLRPDNAAHKCVSGVPRHRPAFALKQTEGR